MLIAELSEIDYAILEFVKNNQPIGIENIKKKFENVDSLEYRVNLLSSGKQINPAPYSSNYGYFLVEKKEWKKDSDGYSLSNDLKIYNLTSFGRKALQDYRVKLKRDNFKMWLKNAWIPIIVSLITNLIIIGTSMLLSRI